MLRERLTTELVLCLWMLYQSVDVRREPMATTGEVVANESVTSHESRFRGVLSTAAVPPHQEEQDELRWWWVRCLECVLRCCLGEVLLICPALDI